MTSRTLEGTASASTPHHQTSCFNTQQHPIFPQTNRGFTCATQKNTGGHRFGVHSEKVIRLLMPFYDFYCPSLNSFSGCLRTSARETNSLSTSNTKVYLVQSPEMINKLVKQIQHSRQHWRAPLRRPLRKRKPISNHYGGQAGIDIAPIWIRITTVAPLILFRQIQH